MKVLLVSGILTIIAFSITYYIKYSILKMFNGLKNKENITNSEVAISLGMAEFKIKEVKFAYLVICTVQFFILAIVINSFIKNNYNLLDNILLNVIFPIIFVIISFLESFFSFKSLISIEKAILEYKQKIDSINKLKQLLTEIKIYLKTKREKDELMESLN
jgi:hypothetical protein